MKGILLLFLVLSFSSSASSDFYEWVHCESKSILGKPRLDPTGKKQTGLDVFLFNRESFIDSFIKISHWYIRYEFAKEIDFDENGWFTLEFPISDFSSKDELLEFLKSDKNYLLIPETLREKPKKIESYDRTYMAQMLKKGVSFECLFTIVTFEIEIKLEPLSENKWRFLFNVDGFKPLTFKFENKLFLSKTFCEHVYGVFLSRYVQFLKSLFK